MSQDRQPVPEQLRTELAFVESGGYRNPGRAHWRPQFVFEDSPTCLNRDPRKPRRPCSECALAEFISQGLGKRGIPCRYIPLNENGELFLVVSGLTYLLLVKAAKRRFFSHAMVASRT